MLLSLVPSVPTAVVVLSLMPRDPTAVVGLSLMSFVPTALGVLRLSATWRTPCCCPLLNTECINHCAHVSLLAVSVRILL